MSSRLRLPGRSVENAKNTRKVDFCVFFFFRICAFLPNKVICLLVTHLVSIICPKVFEEESNVYKHMWVCFCEIPVYLLIVLDCSGGGFLPPGLLEYQIPSPYIKRYHPNNFTSSYYFSVYLFLHVYTCTRTSSYSICTFFNF